MILDADVCYRALVARDSRFDGVFFVGVTSTRIYCRPVCTAKTPGRANCRFFPAAVLAEQAGFRPCLRCRPELAPGNAPTDSARTLARAAVQRIEAGALNDGHSLDELAARLDVSSRQLRRAMRRELGVSPVELAQTNRLLLAKRLITETRLPMTQVAFAAGFESVRRFNALFRRRYRLAPSALRLASAATVASTAADDCLRLSLAFRPPLDWQALVRFLAARAIPGVECVTGAAYHRTVRIGEQRGWLRVAPMQDRNVLAVELALELAPRFPRSWLGCAICSIWMLAPTRLRGICGRNRFWPARSSVIQGCACPGRLTDSSWRSAHCWDSRFPSPGPRRWRDASRCNSASRSKHRYRA